MANPFGQAKELYKMQREARQMQKKLRDKKVTGESKRGEVKIIMNGAQEFEDIEVSEELIPEENIDDFKKALKQSFKDYQKKLQKEMMKDFDIGDLKNMLGK